MRSWKFEIKGANEKNPKSTDKTPPAPKSASRSTAAQVPHRLRALGHLSRSRWAHEAVNCEGKIVKKRIFRWSNSPQGLKKCNYA